MVAELAKSKEEGLAKKSKEPSKFAIDLNADEEESPTVVYNREIEERTTALLQRIWREYNGRMYTKNTSKYFFFERNKDKARELAIKEYEEEQAALASKKVLLVSGLY